MARTWWIVGCRAKGLNAETSELHMAATVNCSARPIARRVGKIETEPEQ